MTAELWEETGGTTHRLGEQNVLGRSDGVDIRLDSVNVSRDHAMIRQQGSGYWLYDLHSANGTLLNEREVREPVQLHHGDIIRLADLTFRFMIASDRDNQPARMGSGFGAMTTVMKTTKEPLILLVADIMDFSGLSKSLGEERVARALNYWYDECRALMERHSGVIDKFMGDGVLAYWKFTSTEARWEALQAAKGLVKGSVNLPEELAEELSAEKTSLRCGVGLHLGHAAAGSLTRGTRTVVGDAVNITFRIEALTRKLGAPILVSAAFLEGWDEGRYSFQSCGSQTLKGYAEPMELFQLREA